jgi:hypothetical protein
MGFVEFVGKYLFLRMAFRTSADKRLQAFEIFKTRAVLGRGHRIPPFDASINVPHRIDGTVLETECDHATPGMSSDTGVLAGVRAIRRVTGIVHEFATLLA